MSEMFCRECEPAGDEHEEGCSFRPQPGQPNAAILKLAFWEAVGRLGEDPRIDADIPAELWEHMAVAIAELRAAAGLGKPNA